MKRKLIKYTKFIISVALIAGLIVPSYAALSASDGSAFVTKAEFDSALADFNSRLTTFEAGINSKIDSQVTSYLDRNGIWSGKAQVVKDDPGYTYGFVSGTSSKTKSTLQLTKDGYTKSNSSDLFGILLNVLNKQSNWNQDESYQKTGVWINEVSKSGLLISLLHDAIDTDELVRVRVAALGTYLADDQFVANYTIRLDFKVNGSVIWAKEVGWSAQCAGTVLSCPVMGDATIMFFVSAKDVVSWELNEAWKKVGASTDYNTTIYCWQDKGRKVTRKYTIDVPSVY